MRVHAQLITELSFVLKSKAIHQREQRKKIKGEQKERVEWEKYVSQYLCRI